MAVNRRSPPTEGRNDIILRDVVRRELENYRPCWRALFLCANMSSILKVGLDAVATINALRFTLS
jgi:hypothetical protein